MSAEAFIDPEFPANENSLLGKTKEGKHIDPVEARYRVIKDSEVEWKRITDIVAQPVIFEDTITMDSVKYGRVSLNYLYAVLLELTKVYPSIFNKIILTQEFNPQGKYEVQLFIDGEYKVITIDDYFPCIRGTNVYYFTRPTNFAIWTVLIEKAWAKVNGGYLNIVNLWSGDFFKALTGFSFEELAHSLLTPEELFDKICYVKANKGFCFSLTLDTLEVKDKGLYGYHTYVVEDTEKIELEPGKNLCLLKLLDPLGQTKWNGDYNPSSPLWTDELKAKVNPEKLNVKNGELLISLDEFHKFFVRTDGCYMLLNGFKKPFKFDKDQLVTPKIFHLSVQEDGMVNFTILEKNWRFHRELRNTFHPTSLIVAEYDPSAKIVKKVYSNYECNEDLSLTVTLPKGLYLVWAYKTIDPNEKIPLEGMTVEFCTLTKASVELIGDDVNFELVRNLIVGYIKEVNKDKVKQNDFFYDVNNSFDKSGIGYQMALNPFTNIHQVWKVDSSATHGFLILPPHENPDLELTLGYNDYQNILGIKKYKYGKHCLNLGIDVTVLRGSQDPPKSEPKPDVSNLYPKDESNLKPIGENPTFSAEEISKVNTYPTLNHWELFLEKYKEKYPLIVEELKKLEIISIASFDLNIIERNQNFYLGEAAYGIRFGRGAFHFGKEGTTYVGYWDKGLQFVKGKVFDENNKLLFEGEYKNGLKEGKGVYNYPDGDKFDGTFVNGLREGPGVFTWSDGMRWEGPFQNDNLNGEGTFFDGKESYKATYKDGDLVEN